MNNLEVKEREEKLAILLTLNNILKQLNDSKIINELTYKRLTAGIEYLITEYEYQTLAGKNRPIKMNYDVNDDIVIQAKVATMDKHDIMVQPCLDLEAKILMEFVKKYLFVENKDIKPEDVTELLTNQLKVDEQIKLLNA